MTIQYHTPHMSWYTQPRVNTQPKTARKPTTKPEAIDATEDLVLGTSMIVLGETMQGSDAEDARGSEDEAEGSASAMKESRTLLIVSEVEIAGGIVMVGVNSESTRCVTAMPRGCARVTVVSFRLARAIFMIVNSVIKYKMEYFIVCVY